MAIAATGGARSADGEVPGADRSTNAEDRARVRDAAFALLAVRPRSRGELQQRLRRKMFAPDLVEYALAEAERLGYLDDAQFAEAWVRDRVRLRPRAANGLVAELARKRVAADVARAAVDRVLRDEEITEGQLCDATAERWLRTRVGKHEKAVLQRRLSSFLQRRGFGAGDIRSALRLIE